MRYFSPAMVRFMGVALLACAGLSGCGGGGGSGNSSSNAAAPASASAAPPASTPVATAPAQPAPPAAPVNTTVTQSTTANVQPITVANIATGTRNMLQTSVTICVPGTTTCQTIDNIQVDTGSQGLRILASVLSPALALPSVTSSAGSTVGQCSVFGTGYTWGAVRSADIQLAGEVAPGTSIQVIADPALPTVPTDCANAGISMQTATTLRSNGILGVGPFAVDCGASCASTALSRWYYACSGGTCTSSTLAVSQQVANPISRFAADNNGLVIELPAVAATGASAVTGTMTFGIGSQANNALGSAQVLPSNTATGFVSTVFQGLTYGTSFIDSGSNGLFLTLTSLPKCGLWFCPTSPQSYAATVTGTDGSTANATFAIGNATTLFGSGNNAFSNLAGPSSSYFDWGLPFFFGRRIFTAIESRVTPAGNGPYYAF